MQKTPIVISVGSIAAVLGLMASWQSLGLPRPAFSTDITPISDQLGDLRSFAKDSRVLILQSERNRYQREILDLDEKISTDPANRELKRYRHQLKQTHDGIDDQIKKLSR